MSSKTIKQSQKDILLEFIDEEFTVGTPGWKAARIIAEIAWHGGFREGFEVGVKEDGDN